LVIIGDIVNWQWPSSSENWYCWLSQLMIGVMTDPGQWANCDPIEPIVIVIVSDDEGDPGIDGDDLVER